MVMMEEGGVGELHHKLRVSLDRLNVVLSVFQFGGGSSRLASNRRAYSSSTQVNSPALEYSETRSASNPVSGVYFLLPSLTMNTESKPS